MFTNKKQGAVDIVTGEGPISRDTLELVQNAVDPCLQSGQPRLVFDMSEVALLDSGGLEYLLDLNDKCVSRGGALRLAAPNNLCQDILDVCGISTQIEVYEDTTRAVGGFSQ